MELTGSPPPGQGAPGRDRPAGSRAEEKRYLREVERHFLRRRGAPLLISPRDWALALAWYEEGIPLSVVLAAIDEVFDRASESETSTRRPRTLAYCARAVEGIWRERQSRTLTPEGVAAPGSESGPGAEARLRLAESLEVALRRLGVASESLGDGASRRLAVCRESLGTAAVDLRSRTGPIAHIESAIAHADMEIGRILNEECDPTERQEAAREAEERLAPHRPHMTASAWKRTLDRAVENRLRERHGLPRLSLMLV
jgi:hypothetical protein